MTELEGFARDLEKIIGRPTSHRPFICEGSPLDCRAFVVGINPATELKAGWWDFWEPGYGFRKRAWLRMYREKRIKAGKRPLSVTRGRIQRVVFGAEAVPVIETNIHWVEKPEPDSDESWTTEAFDLLLERIRSTRIVVHGQSARKRLERKFDCTLQVDRETEVVWQGRSFMVLAIRHLRLVGYDCAWKLGVWISGGTRPGNHSQSDRRRIPRECVSPVRGRSG